MPKPKLPELTLWSIGSQVLIGPSDDPITAKIIRITLATDQHIPSYECEWWSGLDQKTAWVQDFQIIGTYSDVQKIGFKA